MEGAETLYTYRAATEILTEARFCEQCAARFKQRSVKCGFETFGPAWESPEGFENGKELTLAASRERIRSRRLALRANRL